MSRGKATTTKELVKQLDTQEFLSKFRDFNDAFKAACINLNRDQLTFPERDRIFIAARSSWSTGSVNDKTRAILKYSWVAANCLGTEEGARAVAYSFVSTCGALLEEACVDDTIQAIASVPEVVRSSILSSWDVLDRRTFRTTTWQAYLNGKLISDTTIVTFRMLLRAVWLKAPGYLTLWDEWMRRTATVLAGSAPENHKAAFTSNKILRVMWPVVKRVWEPDLQGGLVLKYLNLLFQASVVKQGTWAGAVMQFVGIGSNGMAENVERVESRYTDLLLWNEMTALVRRSPAFHAQLCTAITASFFGAGTNAGHWDRMAGVMATLANALIHTSNVEERALSAELAMNLLRRVVHCLAAKTTVPDIKQAWITVERLLRSVRGIGRDSEWAVNALEVLYHELHACVAVHLSTIAGWKHDRTIDLVSMELLELVGDKQTAGSRNLQLRLLQAHARQSFFDALEDRSAVAGREKMEAILDTHFCLDAVRDHARADRLATAHLEPLCALLEGVVAGATDRATLKASDRERFWFALGNCIGSVIALSATATKFCNLAELKHSPQGDLTRPFLASAAEEFGQFCRRNPVLLSNPAAALGRMQEAERSINATTKEEHGLYKALASSYGLVLYRHKLDSTNSGGKARATALAIADCRDLLQLAHQPPALSTVAFVRLCCDDTAAFLKTTPHAPPRGLGLLMKDLAKDSNFEDEREALAETCKLIAEDVISCQFQKSALTTLLGGDGSDHLAAELGEFLDPDLMAGDLTTHLQFQLVKWNEAERDCDALCKTFTFLDARKMIPERAAAAELFAQAQEQLFLSDLEALVASFGVEIAGEDLLSEASLRALKFFCSKKIAIFVKLFDAVRAEAAAAEWNAEAVTAETLRRLGLLVNTDNARLSDLQLDLQGMVRQLDNRTSQQQKQELCMIGEYFHQDSTQGNLARCRDRLMAASDALLLRELVSPFMSALHALGLGHLNAAVKDSSDWATIRGDFLVSEAPSLLERLRRQLGGLADWHLQLVTQLAAEGTVKAHFLLKFFEKYALEEGFRAVLYRAQDRASSNAHAVSVLLSLPRVRVTLSVFWRAELKKSLTLGHLAHHLEASASTSNAEVVQAELRCVLENWGQIELYFRDGIDDQAGTGDIFRAIKLFQANGQFVSTVSADGEEGGGKLVLTFVEVPGQPAKQVSETELLLRVQQAVFASFADSTTAESAEGAQDCRNFVEAFDAAQKAHALHVELHRRGHPGLHLVGFKCAGASASSFFLGPSCGLADTAVALESLQQLLSEWDAAVQSAIKQCPRLGLLGPRERRQLLLALGGKISNRESSVARTILGYVSLCFPIAHEGRRVVLESLPRILTSMTKAQKTGGGSFNHAVSMLNALGSAMTASGDVDNVDLCTAPAKPEIVTTRVDVVGKTQLEVYQALLTDLVASSRTLGGSGQPGLVLWCHGKVTDAALQHVLDCATVGVQTTIYIVGVNQLVPRQREQLLCALNKGKFMSSVTLIFTVATGGDSFAHIPTCPPPSPATAAELRRSFWAARMKGDGQLICVTVVSGDSGAGKSRWIRKRVEGASPPTRIVVHEGFQPRAFVRTVSALCERAERNDHPAVVLHLDVTEYGDLADLSKLLHFLLFCGVLWDEQSGECFALSDERKLHLFVELPALVDCDSGGKSVWPPAGANDWRTAQHPFLAELPVLTTVCGGVAGAFVEVRSDAPYALNREARVVAKYLPMLEDNRSNLGLVNDASTINFTLEEGPDSDKAYAQVLEQFFRARQVLQSKAIRSKIVALLHTRIRYLARLRRIHCRDLRSRVEHEVYENALLQRLSGQNAYQQLLQLYVAEALACYSEARTTDHAEMAATSVFAVCPRSAGEGLDDEEFPPELCFDVIVSTVNVQSAETQALTAKLQGCKVLQVHGEVVPAEIRSLIAEAFGIRDSSNVARVFQRTGHVLTPEALVKLLHLRLKHSLRSSVLLEGETGCGKSSLVELYTHLVNCNSALYTKVSLHMLAELEGAVQHWRGLAAASNTAVDAEVGAAANALTVLRPSCSVHEMVQRMYDWVSLDPTTLVPLVGTMISIYMESLLCAFPLYEPSATCGTTMKKVKRWCHREIEHVENLWRAVGRANGATFLTGERGYVVFNKDEWTNVEMEPEPVGNPATPSSPAQPAFPITSAEELRGLCGELCGAPARQLYHKVLADENLTPPAWITLMDKIAADAKRFPAFELCVFVDELNTASCLGMVTEAFLTHTVNGSPLPKNIFFCGAINQYKPSIFKTCARDDRSVAALMDIADFARSRLQQATENDEEDYMIGSPYIVRPLPASLGNVMVHFPGMDEVSERIFLREFLKVQCAVPPPDVDEEAWKAIVCTDVYLDMVVALIVCAQERVRGYNIHRVKMSIRNLIRTAQLLVWNLKFSIPTAQMVDGRLSDYQNIFLPRVQAQALSTTLILTEAGLERFRWKMMEALIMAISVNYYFMLPSQGHVHAGRYDRDLRSDFVRQLAHCWKTDPRCTAFTRKFLSALQPSAEQWMETIQDSLEHLWNRATIPAGLAQTGTMMENLYCVVLCAQTSLPLLITGPPGSGKTLSFIVGCENMSGQNSARSVAFQQLKVARKIMYQCSSVSTSQEVAAKFKYVRDLQLSYLQGSADGPQHVCVLGIDEAGLAKENRLILKAMHDPLDRHEHSTVMLSNTTLDAAKTNRSIQLLQTQSNEFDLHQLAEGILLQRIEKPMEAHKRFVRGLCTAYLTINTAVGSDNWFHSRDFVFLCRYLVRSIDATSGAFFTAQGLLAALRRHFQTLDPAGFPALAQHFLKCCGLPVPSIDALRPNIVDTMQAALQDAPDDHTNPSSTHCRYTLLVDPTSSQAAVDLLFDLKLLDAQKTVVVAISDFPGDANSQRQFTELARINACIEKGETLLLINSAPIRSALYDVVNRHYAISVDSQGRNEAYATIALGSFSTCVRVHPGFRLVVHMPQAELATTELPFLNRFEKYVLSVRDALDHKIAAIAANPPFCLESVGTELRATNFFQSILAGAEDFVRYCGNESAFYGLTVKESLPALLLRAIEDACADPGSPFQPRDGILKCAVRVISSGRDDAANDEEEYDFTPNVPSAPTQRLQSIVRALNYQVLESMRMETMFSLKSSLPESYMDEFLTHQEHFSAVAALRMVFAAAAHRRNGTATDLPRQDNLILYTRSDGQTLSRMSGDNGESFASALFGCSAHVVTSAATGRMGQGNRFLRIAMLASLTASTACEAELNASMASGCGVLLVVVDMNLCSAPQVSFARRCVDTYRGGEDWRAPTVVFLIHVEAARLRQECCYYAVPLHGWSSLYVDCFYPHNLSLASADSDSGFAESVDPALHWLKAAFRDNVDTQESENELKMMISTTLRASIQTCNFKQTFRLSPARQRSKFESVGLQSSLAVYQAGNHPELLKALDARPPIVDTIAEALAAAWPRILHSTLSYTCSRIVHGLTTKTLIEDVRASHQWCLLDVVSLLVRRDLAGGWSLEAIMRLPALTTETAICSAGMESKGNDDEDEDGEESGMECDESTAAGQSASETYPFVTKVLQAAIQLHLQTNSVGEKDGGLVAFSIHAGVDCTSSAKASTLPLYLSFMRMIELAVPHGVSRARERKTGKSDQLHTDQFTLRAYIAGSADHVYLNEALQMVESTESLWAAWVSDFIALGLRYADHTEQEVRLLVRIAEILVHAGCANVNMTQRNVLRWVLLQDDLRRYLFAASRTLLATCRAFPELVSEMECLQFSSVGDFVTQLLSATLQRCWQFLWMTADTEVTESPAGRTSVVTVLDCLRHCLATPELSQPFAPTSTPVVLRSATDKNRFAAVVGLLKMSAAFEASAVLNVFRSDASNASVSHAPLLREAQHLGFFPETAADSTDPLRAVLVTIAAAFMLPQEDSPQQRTGSVHAVLDCLYWVLNTASVDQSRWLAPLLAGLSNAPVENGAPEADRRARRVIDGLLTGCSLPANARSQLLCLALRRSPEATERAFDTSLRLSPPSPTKAGRPYIPEFLVSIVRERPLLEGIRPVGSYPIIPAMRDISGSVLFKAYYQHLMTIQDRQPDFEDLAAQAKALANASTSSAAIAHSVVAKMLLDKFAAMVVSAATAADGAKETQSILRSLPPPAVLAVTELLSQDLGRVWSHYLLTMIADPTTLVEVLCDDALLTSLGMGDRTCVRFPPVQEGASLTEEEARQRQAEAQRLNKRVAHVLHLSHAIRTAMAVGGLTADCTPRHIMRNRPAHAQGASTQDKSALAVLELFGSSDHMDGLPANKHIPALVDMSLFLLEKLAFRLRSSGQIADLTVEQALEMLPRAEELTGKAKFAAFLRAWEKLRSVFGTFGQCGNEVATADEIPALTDLRGANPARVMDLVAVEDFPDHVPVVRRMLELRLLLQTSTIVTHPAVQALQESMSAREESMQVPQGSLFELEVEALSENMTSTLLVTNPLQEAAVRDEVNFLVLSLSEGFAPKSAAPPAETREREEPNGVQVSLEQYIATTQMQIARDSQMQAHLDGSGCCPNCKRVVFRHINCQHVCCGRPNDPYGRDKTAPLYAVHNGVRSGDLGCGTPFDITLHRVPAPAPNGKVLDFFKPIRVAIPAHLLGTANLQLPLLPQVSVTYNLDCEAIAAQLLRLGVCGRPRLVLGERIKRPLLLIPAGFVEDTAATKEIVLDSTQLSADTNVFARLRYTSDLLWGKSPPPSSTDLRDFKSILQNQPESTLETIAGVLLRGCLCISAVSDRAAGGTGAMKIDAELESMTLGKIVETYLSRDEQPKPRMPLRTSQVIDALPYSQLHGAAHLLCEAGLNSWGISGNRSAAPLPSACAKHWKELQAEILAAAGSKSTAAAETAEEAGHKQEKVQVVQAQLQTLSTLLQAKKDHFAVLQDSILIRDADGAIQGFLMQPNNALLHKLVAELELRYIPALERAVRVILGNIAYSALTGSSNDRSSKVAPQEESGLQASTRPKYTECACLLPTPPAQPDTEETADASLEQGGEAGLAERQPNQADDGAEDLSDADSLIGTGNGCALSYPLRYDRDALIAQSTISGATEILGESRKDNAVSAAEAVGWRPPAPLPPALEWSKEGLTNLWYAGMSLVYSRWIQKDNRA